MYKKFLSRMMAVTLAAAMIVTCAPSSLTVKEAKAATVTVEDASAELKAIYDAVTLPEEEVKLQVAEDFTLALENLGKATATWSVKSGAEYIALEEANGKTTAKITRPFAGEGNKDVVLTATIDLNGESIEKDFNLIIREGLSDDSYAGYIYVCFADINTNYGIRDVQQVHFFLSEDGLNWTALNGFNPIFQAGSDFADYIEPITSSGGTQWKVSANIDDVGGVEGTTEGDASVLFPFEGNDQGIRDPYLIQGCREEDKGKTWILATDLNTMATKYSGNPNNSTVGNWGTMSSRGSTKLFIYETEDWVNWTRRWVDVGAEIGAGAAWAPEAIYNPEKDNYLVYWSCRIQGDGLARNRLYCNETKDFVTFGPTKLYEAEPFYQNYLQYASTGYQPATRDASDGFGNIDTSQLWVADEDGNPYGTVYRLVKDETNNHIELMSADTVLDPNVDYNESDPTRKNTAAYESTLVSGTDLADAEQKYNWYKDESVGNHFVKISQPDMEKYSGAYEGATMFKFFDREEWCIMIDNYGNMSIRYEPFTTTDLSKPESVKKVASGYYGRTGGDIGCHGGMIPITVEEYNTLLDNYNADASVPNYHEIDYIEVDKRPLQAAMDKAQAEVDLNKKYGAGDIELVKKLITEGEKLVASTFATSKKMNAKIAEIDKALGALKTVEQVEAEEAEKKRQEELAKQEAAKQEAAKKEAAKQAAITKANAALVSSTVTGATTLYAGKNANIKYALPADVSTAVNSGYLTVSSVKYASSKASIAKVDAAGKVTAVKNGKAAITTTITLSTGKSVSLITNITVKNPTIKINGKTSVKVKKSITLKAKLTGVSGKVKWKITKGAKYAKINAKGKLTGKKKGTVTVQASVGKWKATKKIKIKK